MSALVTSSLPARAKQAAPVGPVAGKIILSCTRLVTGEARSETEVGGVASTD